MRLSAIDSIQHGLLNLRANWQLVIAQFLQTLSVTVISILGLLPIVFALGFTFVRGALENFDSRGGSELLERVLEAGVPLVVALLATILIWTIAFVVYCYFMGGIFGVLAQGERQALSAEAGWKSYRAFSTRGFFDFSERLTWPIFWLVNVFVLIGLIVLAGCAVIVVGLVMLLDQGPQVVRFGLGCLVLLLLALFMMFLSVWMQLALAELARGTRGFLSAVKAALAIAGKRLPGVAVLFLLLIVASITMAIVFVPVSLVLEIAFRDRMGAYFLGQALVSLVQWLSSGILTVAWSATCVALVIGEQEAAA
jgi:hypothetical protein